MLCRVFGIDFLTFAWFFLQGIGCRDVASRSDFAKTTKLQAFIGEERGGGDGSSPPPPALRWIFC